MGGGNFLHFFYIYLHYSYVVLSKVEGVKS